jgi:hypothetical protein
MTSTRAVEIVVERDSFINRELHLTTCSFVERQRNLAILLTETERTSGTDVKRRREGKRKGLT